MTDNFTPKTLTNSIAKIVILNAVKIVTENIFIHNEI